MYSTSSFINTRNVAKRMVKAALGRDHLWFSELRLPKLRLGTEYGGWFIAPGVLPAGGRPVVLSFGIGDDISFDLEMIQRFCARVYAFDPTPKSLAWLARQRGLPATFRAFPYGVADFDGTQCFSLPTVADWDDYSIRRSSTDQIECPVWRIATVMEELELTRVDVLKLDIEGSEYSVLRDFAAGELRPAQLLVEFHHGRDGIAVAETKAAVEMVRELGYRIFDVSPWGREFSFVHETAWQEFRSDRAA